MGGYDTQATAQLIGCQITNNVFHDLCTGVNGYMHVVAYNTIYNIGPWNSTVPNCGSIGGFHPDTIQDNTDSNIHDNVIWNGQGAETIEVTPNDTPGFPVSYVYNNVVFVTSTFSNPSGELIPLEVGTGGGGVTPNGVIYIENNTFECDQGGTQQGCISIFFNINTLTIQNNHLIGRGSNADICVNNPPISNTGCGIATTFNYTPSSELYQTLAAANAAGYTSTQAYAFSPTSASSPSATIGVSLASSCSAAFAVCTDTTYGSAVGTGNISVLGRTAETRLPSAWGAGAYTFNSGSSTLPAPPNGLVANVTTTPGG
jgi:hypothetical protein